MPGFGFGHGFARRRGGGGGYDYYVDSVGGSDSNAGTSAAAPVQTWAGLEAKGDLTGKRIRVADGSIFREQVEIPDNAVISPATEDGRWYVSGADLLANASFSLTPTMTNTYQISLPSIPSTTNPYAGVSNANVLQVWEDDARLGYSFHGKTSIAQVEAAAGSWWWDSTNKILYVHPTGSGNPITNGKTYEASVRTLAVHGGDGFTVEGVVGEKAGAATTTGQQGYGILGYKSGTYNRSVGRWGWNHCGGVANAEVAAPLHFNQCEFYDHERQVSSTASTCFVAYKAGASNSDVIIEDCYVHMPTYNSGYADIGFFAHGTRCNAIWRGENHAKNFGYGRQHVIDGGTAAHTVEDTLVVNGGQYGMLAATSIASGLTFNVVAKSMTQAAASIQRTCTINVRAIDCLLGITAGNGTVGQPVLATAAAPIVIQSTSPAGNPNDSFAIQGLGAYSQVQVNDGFFYYLGMAYTGDGSNHPIAAGSDDNEYSGCVRIYSNTSYSPSYSDSLATWQTASGLDAASTVTSDTPASPLYDLPTWVGTVLGAT